MRCSHPGPELPTELRSCNKNPCETGGVPKRVYLGSTRKREPCDDCIANGTWYKVPGSINRWEPVEDWVDASHEEQGGNDA